MKKKIYVNNHSWIAGMTLKNDSAREQNNMALHSCLSRDDILKNRQQLANDLNIKLNQFVCSNQTHSANFHKVTATDKGRGAFYTNTAIPNSDALYTYEPGLLLCSFAADCVPVIFYHSEREISGVIHSGWRGTIQEITFKLFHHLIHNENCRPAHFHIQIGPALSQEKFEVDADVQQKFFNLGYADDFMIYNQKTNKYHIDNQLTVKKQCELAGIPPNQISIDQSCTFVSDDWFSYRKNKTSGRHMAFIMKKGH